MKLFSSGFFSVENFLYIYTIIKTNINTMKIVKLYQNQQQIQELNKFEQLAVDIVNGALSKSKDLDIAKPLAEKPMENWGKWLQRIELKISEKQLNIVSRNLSLKQACLDEEQRIFANLEFGLFTPKYGNNYGIIEVHIFQSNK